jgi:hypothetical protein
MHLDLPLLLMQSDYASFAAKYPNWPYWFFGGSLLWGIIAWLVGNGKGNGCLGCILGLLLGPFGLLITALLGARNRG